ncbi:ABC transporter permease [Oryzicola mucosus]|uniref:Iron ABC transporter permease n=1 Tax=Oryzicola mucosus TaxID=2767425 RepID=A0A8J6U6I9_9HYPH|nr:iron ABC transporter permease [Oryzicola mucosus]
MNSIGSRKAVDPVRPPRHPLLRSAALLVSAIVLLPIIALAFVALSGSGEDWPHLVQNVLPGSIRSTLLLMSLVAVMTAVVGVASAWAVVAYDFPFRKTLSWMLVLPFAVPPYLAAYAYGEFLHFHGPLQGMVRALFGFQTIRDYWFPDIRTTQGTAFVLAAVLYPYVYMTTRVVFLMQGRNIADVARTLGASPRRVFWRVLLPVARPAIVAGLALVLMETINDVGAAEYFGVRTLTVAVYTTWLNRNSLEGGAQIALIMLLLVFVLLVAEQWVRRRQRYHAGRSTQMKVHPPRVRIVGFKRWAMSLTLLLPVLCGFGVPLLIFGQYASRRMDQFFAPALGKALFNSLTTATLTALLTVTVALLLLNVVRLCRGRGMIAVVRLASIGYALPGGILGLGLLFSLARFDNTIDAFFRANFGFSTGLLLTGSAAAVVLACTIRFVALAEGSIRSGMEKLPAGLDDAARSLGRTPVRSALSVLLPLLRPAILTAAVLVFVDTVKELSATILLRPFGFNTLATHVYENASRGVPQDGAAAALTIILTAMVPVLLLSGALMRDADAHL